MVLVGFSNTGNTLRGTLFLRTLYRAALCARLCVVLTSPVRSRTVSPAATCTALPPQYCCGLRLCRVLYGGFFDSAFGLPPDRNAPPDRCELNGQDDSRLHCRRLLLRPLAMLEFGTMFDAMVAGWLPAAWKEVPGTSKTHSAGATAWRYLTYAVVTIHGFNSYTS